MWWRKLARPAGEIDACAQRQQQQEEEPGSAAGADTDPSRHATTCDLTTSCTACWLLQNLQQPLGRALPVRRGHHPKAIDFDAVPQLQRCHASIPEPCADAVGRERNREAAVEAYPPIDLPVRASTDAMQGTLRICRRQKQSTRVAEDVGTRVRSVVGFYSCTRAPRTYEQDTGYSSKRNPLPPDRFTATAD